MDFILLLILALAIYFVRKRNKRVNPPYQTNQPYQQPKRRGGCLTKILWVILGLVILTNLVGDKKETKPNRLAQVNETTVEEVEEVEEIEKETTEEEIEATTEETTEETTEDKSDYDLVEMNLQIADSFEESVEFNEQGHDGYEWSQFVYEIELQKSEAVYITTNELFDSLSDEDKTFVLNATERAVNGTIMIATNGQINKHRTVRAFNRDGEEIATSGMFNTTEFEFKD